jgi:ketosteroid isomerase-like protein
MLWQLTSIALLMSALLTRQMRAASGGQDEQIREFIARWNAAYTGLDAPSLAALEMPDYEMIDRFGHWIKSEGPEFNERLWARTFKEIYHGKPGPARQIESIRFLAPNIAIVQARANHAQGVTLDDGTKIPPFWEMNTYTLIRTERGWRVALLNIHNQIDPSLERPGEHVPAPSTK